MVVSARAEGVGVNLEKCLLLQQDKISISSGALVLVHKVMNLKCFCCTWRALFSHMESRRKNSLENLKAVVPLDVQDVLPLPKKGTFYGRKTNTNNYRCNRFLKIKLCYSPHHDESSSALQKGQRDWGQSPSLTFSSPDRVKLFLLGLD